MESTGEARWLGRRPALDGLRGLAALVVVVHHTLLLDPMWAASYAGAPTGPWLFVHSPLRLLWAGEVAVAVFFTLSGYVLARPYLRRSGARWRGYYPKRLLRLYLPVIAGVTFACAVITLVPRTMQPDRSWWFAAHLVQVNSKAFWDASLWSHSGLNSALWSLKWEVLFSLMLPAYVMGARMLRRYGSAFLLVALLTLCAAGWVTGVGALQYLPVFGLGVLVADREAEFVQRAASWSRGPWLALVLASVALATIPVYPLQALSAVLVLLAATHCQRIAAITSRSPAIWLGKVSFSLYLVHLPLIFAVVAWLPGWSAPQLLLVTVPVSLGFAAVFYRVVELPSLRVAARASSGRQPKLTHQGLANNSVTIQELPDVAANGRAASTSPRAG